MTTVHAQEYEGPERRRALIIEQCACHLKHEAVLNEHSDGIKIMNSELKQKVSWKLFSMFVGIVVISTAFVYREIRATSLHMEARLESMDDKVDSRMDSIDKSLQVTIIRQQLFEINTNNTLSEIKDIIRRIDENVHRHLEDVREINGFKK